ncbi:hypothetical protein IX307_000884 [Bacteroides pyogenes]|uniref:DUF488 domain-containing protein n=1 Tax=Bacteroides pyogenes TaxID=310300 RepID=UPI001BA85F7A|nr:DUF488 domain-containing protein [Bacteroides pyogenes]MBR8706231.1 hypothetical protein [Bacteroides pyogenes]MBR8719583.1 hypothetical protein [Bacteroides pyogenes]MBR8786575.1 hypothetical protein [Bacteroides pyogenes]MBR8792058.1 hypothetical protein [Bacteroides pyogenes]
MEFFTIGVYKSTEEDFFKKLTDNNIDTFCDIRQRRGVRGSEYCFVNSNYLQQKLHELDIKYRHVINLAPTSEIRDLQKRADLQAGEQKRNRNKLGKVFTVAYKEKILNLFDFDYFIKQLSDIEANKVALFCVEEKAEACHRSIVADKLEKLEYRVTHL